MCQRTFLVLGSENAIGGLVGDTFPMMCGGFNFNTSKECYIFNGTEKGTYVQY